MNLEELEKVGENIDKLVQQRDDIVSHVYRTMFFLASLLILIFLIEINLVAIPNTVWGVSITSLPGQSQQDVVNNQDVFIFGFLLIGNIVALLLSSAMVKAFTVEYTLKTYYDLTTEGPSGYIAAVTSRFHVFVFDLIAKQPVVPELIKRISIGIHWVTVVALPLTFIFLYCFVLVRAMTLFWTKPPTGVLLLGVNIERWYFYVLLFFNVLTLSFYAFAFFPCPTPTISRQRFRDLVNQRINELGERQEADGGKRSAKFKQIELLAERQVRLCFRVKE